MMFEWYKYLCEYYNVTPYEALELGTRKTGRKPNLPGSVTCNPVSGKTFEDIWEEHPRKTIPDIFKFYKDQGAWSSFRQSVRHKDLENLHLGFLKYASQIGVLKQGSHICEYGCGVAPFITTFMKHCPDDSKIKITVTDLDCEHFSFAQYKLKRIKEERNLKNIEINFLTIDPYNLPNFGSFVDLLFCFEVMEHVPSPLSVISNINNQLNSGAIYAENFIKHEDDKDDGPDLLSARLERNKYYEFLNENFKLIHPSLEESNANPNVTRIWRKN